MAGLKTNDSGFRFSGVQVTPDEIWGPKYYDINNPSIDNQWFGTCKGTSTQSIAITAINKIADYPRNMAIIVSVASGSTKGGTAVVNGKDQFGNVISESLVVDVAANGGTTYGTKIFSSFTDGTWNIATSNGGNGTLQLGMGTAGTTTLFGLPWKIGGTSDIKRISGSFNGVGTSTAGTFVFGGTPSSAAVTGVHAFKAPMDLQAGTCFYKVTVIPTYDASADGPITTLGTNTGPSAIQTTG